MLKLTIGRRGTACRTQEGRGRQSMVKGRGFPKALAACDSATTSPESHAALQIPRFHTPKNTPPPSLDSDLTPACALPALTPTGLRLGGSCTCKSSLAVSAFVSTQDTGVCNSALFPAH